MPQTLLFFCFFFFNDTATTEIYTLSLHDALPIFDAERALCRGRHLGRRPVHRRRSEEHTSELQSHVISYAVFCLKKKKKTYHLVAPRHVENKQHKIRLQYSSM